MRSHTAISGRTFWSTTSSDAPHLRISATSIASVSAAALGAKPRLSSSTIRMRGRATRPRAIATICCWPPLRKPAAARADPRSAGTQRPQWPRRRRKNCSPIAAQPSRRLSRTVRLAIRPRPSGTCSTPARATMSGAAGNDIFAQADRAAARDQARRSPAARSSCRHRCVPARPTTAPAGTSRSTPRSTLALPKLTARSRIGGRLASRTNEYLADFSAATTSAGRPCASTEPRCRAVISSAIEATKLT